MVVHLLLLKGSIDSTIKYGLCNIWVSEFILEDELNVRFAMN